MSNVLTCVYCGMAYPEGTPPHGAKILTDHIKICLDHPTREAEAKILRLREALEDLLGSYGLVELKSMKKLYQRSPVVNNAKIEGINALIDTATDVGKRAVMQPE